MNGARGGGDPAERLQGVAQARDAGRVTGGHHQRDGVEKHHPRPLPEAVGEERLRILVPEVGKDKVRRAGTGLHVHVVGSVDLNTVARLRLERGEELSQEPPPS